MEFDDIEKSRVERVVYLEAQLAHALKEVDTYKSKAQQWEPIVKLSSSGKDPVISLTFGGKIQSVSIPSASLLAQTETDLLTAVVDALIAGGVNTQLKTVVLPVLKSAMANAKVVDGAGKW